MMERMRSAAPSISACIKGMPWRRSDSTAETTSKPASAT
jgi:hypothetical protein